MLMRLGLCFFVAIFVSMLAPPLQKGWLKCVSSPSRPLPVMVD